MCLSWNSFWNFVDFFLDFLKTWRNQYITASKVATFENCEIFSNFLFLIHRQLWILADGWHKTNYSRHFFITNSSLVRHSYTTFFILLFQKKFQYITMFWKTWWWSWIVYCNAWLQLKRSKTDKIWINDTYIFYRWIFPLDCRKDLALGPLFWHVFAAWFSPSLGYSHLQIFTHIHIYIYLTYCRWKYAIYHWNVQK